ncbi:hypothetical protein CYMTET_3091 [Cymbomonas tetramitiformis]|nr:hypothetical protein CYMTET_3091 [Cymbomonas tetramitiformis]
MFCNLAFLTGVGVVTLNYKTHIELYLHNMTSNEVEDAPLSSDNVARAAFDVRGLLNTAHMTAAVVVNDTSTVREPVTDARETAVRSRVDQLAHFILTTEESMQRITGQDTFLLIKAITEIMTTTDMQAVNELLRNFGRNETVQSMLTIATRGLNDVDAARDSTWRLMHGLREALDVYARNDGAGDDYEYERDAERRSSPRGNGRNAVRDFM